MKIAFLDQSGQLGGAELMLLDLVPHLTGELQTVLLQEGPFRRRLEQEGHKVTVIDLQKAVGGTVTKRAGWVTLLRTLPGVWGVSSRILNQIAGCDILYANTAKAWVIGALVAFRRKQVSLVCHLHDILSPAHFSLINRRLMVFCANRFSRRVIANSQASADAFVDAGGNERLVKVIPNGFDLKAFANLGHADEPNSLRSTLGVPEKPLIMMVGRLTVWKGQDVFIKAISLLTGVHGVIVGDALFTDEDRIYANSLPVLADELGCRDRIHFLGFNDDVVSLLHQADIVVHCSTHAEPFGRVIVEAMLCGKPVIVAGEGGAAEIVEDGHTGLHHRPGDHEHLSQCIGELLKSPSTGKALAERALLRATERYDQNKVAEMIQGELNELI